MTNLTQINWTDFRRDMNEAVADVCRSYGIQIEFGNVTYSADVARMKMNIAVGDNAAEAERSKFDHYCRNYGFTPEDYGTQFIYKGVHYTLVGFKPTGRKNTTIIRDDQGRTYVASHIMVKNLIENSAEA